MTDSDQESDLREEAAQVVSLGPWERALHRARRAERAFSPMSEARPEALLENERRMAAATPLEAYYALKSRGLEDSIHALAHISTEQARTLLDLEAWQGDGLDIPDLLSWLEGFRAAGHATLVRAARALDAEALATLFRRRLYIALAPKEDRSEADEPLPEWLHNPSEDLELLQTPDARFLIAARPVDARVELEGEDWEEVDEEERKQVVALVRELYLDEDWEHVAGVLRLAHGDLVSVLEEEAYGLRSGRVKDLGFPTREEALEVYAPLSPDVLEGPSTAVAVTVHEEDRLPLVHAETLGAGALDEALRGLSVERERQVEADLLHVANAMIVADGLDPADVDGVREILQRLRGGVELGLTTGDAELGGRIARLENHHPRVLFQVGQGRVAALVRRAHALLQHPGLGGIGLDALDAPSRSVLEALRRRRPSHVEGLSLGPDGFQVDPERLDSLRPFLGEADLGAVGACIEELEGLATASSELKLFGWSLPPATLPDDERERDLDHRFSTLFASRLLGRAPSPLDHEACLALVDAIGMRFRDGEMEGADGLLDTVAEEVSAAARGPLIRRGRSLMARLGERLFSLVGEERIDLRHFEGLLRAR